MPVLNMQMQPVPQFLAEPLLQPYLVPQPQPEPQLLLLTLPLECPFAWKAESFTIRRQIRFFPEGANPTISFTEKRSSKILGYIPIIGTIIGLFRIFKGIQEYRLFKNTHLHSLSQRSIKWITRGAIELVPVLGGIVCMIADLIATLMSKNSPNILPLPDDTLCGHCHRCGYCRC